MSAPEFLPAHLIIPFVVAACTVKAATDYCSFSVSVAEKTKHFLQASILSTIVMTIGYARLIPSFGAWAPVPRPSWARSRSCGGWCAPDRADFDMQLPWKKVALVFAEQHCRLLHQRRNHGDSSDTLLLTLGAQSAADGRLPGRALLLAHRWSLDGSQRCIQGRPVTPCNGSQRVARGRHVLDADTSSSANGSRFSAPPRAPDLTFGGRYRVLLTGSGTRRRSPAALLAARAGGSAERKEVLLPRVSVPPTSITATRLAGATARAIDIEERSPWLDPSSPAERAGQADARHHRARVSRRRPSAWNGSLPRLPERAQSSSKTVRSSSRAMRTTSSSRHSS